MVVYNVKMSYTTINNNILCSVIAKVNGVWKVGLLVNKMKREKLVKLK